MSWDIMLFNTKQAIKSIEEIDEKILEPTDFTKILENSFENIEKDNNHREIIGQDFTIEFFIDIEPKSNMLLHFYGENGFFEIIELSKINGWLIFDTGLGEIINLEYPENNGFKNHKEYIRHIKK